MTMLTTILISRKAFLAVILSALFGASAARAQTAQPANPGAAQPAATQGYVFTLENFQILNTRSLRKDTDHVSFSIKVGDKAYPAKIKHVGDVNNGTHKVNLSFGPIDIPSPDTKIVMTYLIMNSGHDKDKVSGWLQKGSETMLEKESGGSSEFSHIVKYLGKLSISVIFANCDGWVAGDHVALTGKTLADWGAQHRETRDYKGQNSPRGCGANSHYKVTWSVSKK
jgi:hypothetical protein